MMNKLLPAVTLLMFFTSCDEASDSQPEQGDLFPQTWKLVQMSGSMENSATSGSDMLWQEEYLLRFGNSFTKRRTQDSVTNSISGLFTIETIGTDRYISFIYPNDNELIGSCTGDNTERWMFQSEKVAEGNWQQCDGPGLIYNLVE